MVVVAVNHLLDVVVVIAVVADLPLVSDPIADAGNGACDWHDSLYLWLSPDSCHPLRYAGDDAVERPLPAAVVSMDDSHKMFSPSRAGRTAPRVGRRKGRPGLAEGAVRPG